MIRRPVTTNGRSQCWSRDQEMSWSERRYTPWPRHAECWILADEGHVADAAEPGAGTGSGKPMKLTRSHGGTIYDKKIYIS